LTNRCLRGGKRNSEVIYMWSRAILKANAKQVLSDSYWPSFVVCLLGAILCGGGVGVNSGRISYNYNANDHFYYGHGTGYMLALLFFAFFAFLFIIAFSIFVSGPTTVGISHYFIRTPYGQKDIVQMFTPFKRGRYLSTVKTMFFKNLYIFLWGLLFVIPGIIKSYEYRMVPYIISENPELSPTEAIAISRQMTHGHKLDMFVLDLSFIGWLLLGSLLCGVGTLFVIPYVEATWAQLYFVLRQNASGMQSPGGYPPPHSSTPWESGPAAGNPPGGDYYPPYGSDPQSGRGGTAPEREPSPPDQFQKNDADSAATGNHDNPYDSTPNRGYYRQNDKKDDDYKGPEF